MSSGIRQKCANETCLCVSYVFIDGKSSLEHRTRFPGFSLLQ